MGEDEKNKTLSYLGKLKQRAVNQENYGGEFKAEEAKMEIHDCPECGAGRAFQKGLTACAYCGFKFMDIKLTSGLYIKKENNS